MKKILLLLLIAASFSGCEKDDICTDETTPRLVLEFYDEASPSTLKNVTSLKITGEGMSTDLGTFSGVSKVLLPLKDMENVTKYTLVRNSNSPTLINVDKLEFNYTRETVFVSRACGYKTIYKLNNANGVIRTDATPADLEWIQSISVQTNNINTEDEVHIKIYF